MEHERCFGFCGGVLQFFGWMLNDTGWFDKSDGMTSMVYPWHVFHPPEIHKRSKGLGGFNYLSGASRHEVSWSTRQLDWKVLTANADEDMVPCFACEHLQNTDHTNCDFCLETGLLCERTYFFSLTTHQLLDLLKLLPKDEAIAIAEKRKEQGALYMLHLTAAEKYYMQMAAIDNWCTMDKPLFHFVIPLMNDDGTLFKHSKLSEQQLMNELTQEVKDALPEGYEEEIRKAEEEENRKIDNLIQELNT